MRLRQRFAESLRVGTDAAPLVAAAPTVPVREIFRRFWPLALTLFGGLVSFVDEYLAASIGERFLP